MELKMLELKMLLKLFVKMPTSGRGGDHDVSAAGDIFLGGASRDALRQGALVRGAGHGLLK